MKKWLVCWNIVLTVLLLVVVVNGCSTYDSRYDSLYAQVETNRQNIVNIAEATDDVLKENREYIQQNREAIIQMGDIVNQQNEYLGQQSSDLNKLKLLLQILAAL